MKTGSKIAIAAAAVGAWLIAKSKKAISGIGSLTTKELENKMWGFGSAGGGRIHYYVDFRGEIYEIESNNTIAYDRIKEHEYGEIDDRIQNENWLTYRQALVSLWADAMDYLK